jgi:hypothetical protein
MAISLGSINFGLAPDTSRLQSAMRDVVNFGNAIDSMAASVGGASNQVVDAMSRQEKAMTAALARIQQYNDQVRRAGAPEYASVQGSDERALPRSAVIPRIPACDGTFQCFDDALAAWSPRVEAS